MNTIKFNDEEVDFLRTQYQAELEETEKYLAHLKGLIKKLGTQKPQKVTETIKVPKKRGRKPKSTIQSIAPLADAGLRKSRSDKGEKRFEANNYMLTKMVIDPRKPSEIKKKLRSER